MSQTTTRSRDLSSCSDTVLYDVFYEAGTQLGGSLAALQAQAEAAGDVDAERGWLREAIELQRARAAVGARDRQAQIEAIHVWSGRRAELEPRLSV